MFLSRKLFIDSMPMSNKKNKPTNISNTTNTTNAVNANKFSYLNHQCFIIIIGKEIRLRSHAVDLREKKIRRITVWGSFLNIVLSLIKMGAGLLVRSASLIADGVHSLSDLGTDLIVLVSAKLSSRPADKTHPYGHQKFETLGAGIMGLFLLAVGFGFVYSAGRAIILHEHSFPGPVVVIVAGISLVAKEILFYLTRKVSRETHSSSLFTNAWHHRSDSLSSLAVMIGGVAGLLGYGHADHVAAVVVGFMIMGVGGKIVYEGMIELVEHSADEETLRKVKGILDSEKSVFSWHALRSRKLGGEIFIDVHICVNPSLSVSESHEITNRLEERISFSLKNPVNILIHVDPKKGDVP